MREGGADLRLFDRRPMSELEEILVGHARQIADGFGPRLAGFMVIGWDQTGEYNMGSRVPYESAIPLTLLPSWIADIVRRELVTSEQVRNVLDMEYVGTGG